MLVADSTAELYKRYTQKENLLDFFSPEKYQQGFLDSTARLVIGQGSNRSGKTECAAVKCINVVTHNHPLNKLREWNGPIYIRAIAVSLEVGYDVIVGKFRRFTPRSKLRYPSFEKSYNRRERKLHFKDGGYIHFLSNDQDVEKHSGSALHGIWCDEQPDEPIFNENLARLGDYDGFAQVTLTPDKGAGFLHKNYIGKAAPGTDIECYFFDLLKNPYLNRVEYIKRFANFPERIRNAKIYGKAYNMSGLVYPEFEPSIHIIDPFLPDENYQLFIGIDFGINNPSAATFWAINSRNETFQFDEVYVVNETVGQFGERVRDKVLNTYQKLKFRYCRYDPNSGAQRGLQTKETIAKTFRKALGFGPICPGERGPGSVDHRINCMHMLLLPDKDTNWSKFKITRNCVNTIKEFGLYSYKKDTEKKNRLETPNSKDDHAMNANEYLAEKLPSYRVTNPGVYELKSQYSRGGII